MNPNLDKLDKLTSERKSGWLEKANSRKSNEQRLNLSFKISVRILRVLRQKGMTQKDLAERIGVSPQYINKIIKGTENLSLETIVAIGRALSTNLFDAISSANIVIDGTGKITFGRISIKYTSFAAGYFEKVNPQQKPASTISSSYNSLGVYEPGSEWCEEKAA